MKSIKEDLQRRLGSNPEADGVDIGNHAWLYIEIQGESDIWEVVCSDVCKSTEFRALAALEEDIQDFSCEA